MANVYREHIFCDVNSPVVYTTTPCKLAACTHGAPQDYDTRPLSVSAARPTIDETALKVY